MCKLVLDGPFFAIYALTEKRGTGEEGRDMALENLIFTFLERKDLVYTDLHKFLLLALFNLEALVIIWQNLSSLIAIYLCQKMAMLSSVPNRHEKMALPIFPLHPSQLICFEK